MLFLKKSSISTKPQQLLSAEYLNNPKSDEFDTLEYKRMNADERRQYRRNTDLRLRNQIPITNEVVNDQNSIIPQIQLCLASAFGKCENAMACGKSHEMRPQRHAKLCFQIKGNGFCINGTKCPYMHPNEFPCKLYYLGSTKYHDITKCGWMHSGPLTNEWRDILINYVVKTQNQFGNENEIRQQFDEQHRKLIKSHQAISNNQCNMLSTTSIEAAPILPSNNSSIDASKRIAIK